MCLKASVDTLNESNIFNTADMFRPKWDVDNLLSFIKVHRQNSSCSVEGKQRAKVNVFSTDMYNTGGPDMVCVQNATLFLTS